MVAMTPTGCSLRLNPKRAFCFVNDLQHGNGISRVSSSLIISPLSKPITPNRKYLVGFSYQEDMGGPPSVSFNSFLPILQTMHTLIVNSLKQHLCPPIFHFDSFLKPLDQEHMHGE